MQLSSCLVMGCLCDDSNFDEHRGCPKAGANRYVYGDEIAFLGGNDAFSENRKARKGTQVLL